MRTAPLDLLATLAVPVALFASMLAGMPALAGEGVVIHVISLPPQSGGLGSYSLSSNTPTQVDTIPISGSVPKFPACANRTLTNVGIELTTTTFANISASGSSGFSTSVTGLLVTRTNWSGPGFNRSAIGPNQWSSSLSLNPKNQFQAQANLAPAPAVATVEASPTFLAAYVGTGNVGMSGTVVYQQGGYANPYPAVVQYYRGTNLQLRVTYTYRTPRPDVNGDLTVDAADLSTLLSDWGSTGGGFADIDEDGVVGAADLAALLSAWGPIACE